MLDNGYIAALNQATNAKIYVPKDTQFDKSIYKQIDLSRETFGKYFHFINRGIKNNIVAIDDFDWFGKAKIGANANMNYTQFVAALYTFAQLGLYDIYTQMGEFRIKRNNVENTRLENSNFYNILQFVTKIL